MKRAATRPPGGRIPEFLTRVVGTGFKRNVATILILQALTVLIGTAQAAIIGRWLGPEGKGVVTLALLIPMGLWLVFGGAISYANVYFTGSGRIPVPLLSSHSMAFAALTTLFGSVIYLPLVWTGALDQLLPGVPRGLLLLAFLGLPVTAATMNLAAIMQGLERTVTVTALQLAGTVLTAIMTIVLVVGMGWGAEAAVWAWLAGVTVNLIGVAVLLRREGAQLRPALNKEIARKLLSFGLRGQPGALLNFLNLRLDVYFVAVFHGAAAVGLYSVSTRLAELLWYLPSAAGFALFPRAASRSEEEMNVFTPRVLKWTLALTALGAVGLAVVGRPLIQLVFSARFVRAYYPLLLLLPGAVLMGGTQVLLNEMVGRGLPHYSSMIIGCGLLFTVALDIALIPRYGIVGAAIASSVAYSVTFVLALLSSARMRRKPGGRAWQPDLVAPPSAGEGGPFPDVL